MKRSSKNTGSKVLLFIGVLFIVAAVIFLFYIRPTKAKDVYLDLTCPKVETWEELVSCYESGKCSGTDVTDPVGGCSEETAKDQCHAKGQCYASYYCFGVEPKDLHTWCMNNQ